MILTIYIIILIYFFLGSLGFYYLNRRKDAEQARKTWVKFISYFVIINILFFSIVLNTIYFRYITILIIGFGFFELFKLFSLSKYSKAKLFLISIIIFSIFSIGFFFFGKLDKKLILFSFLILSIFDSFSQITGQIWGRKKIMPKISPNKTLGGLLGGATIALISSFLLKDLYVFSFQKTFILTIGIILFAFLGDLATSLYKRKYQVKDYSNIIPGHGGFLDRFDSLIASGAWVSFFVFVLDF